MMPQYPESIIQRQSVQWFRIQYPAHARLLFSVPNGEKREKKVVFTKKGPRTICPAGKRLKEEGQTPGVSDLILLISRSGFNSLCIEMKAPGEYQSPEQKSWQKLVEEQRNKYVVCRSLDEFMGIVNNYLSKP
jgi:hypothetical protein